MFPLAVFLFFFSYAMAYTGAANLRNGGTGPTLRQAIGLTTAVAPPGSESPNLTGQPPA